MSTAQDAAALSSGRWSPLTLHRVLTRYTPEMQPVQTMSRLFPGQKAKMAHEEAADEGRRHTRDYEQAEPMV